MGDNTALDSQKTHKINQCPGHFDPRIIPVLVVKDPRIETSWTLINFMCFFVNPALCYHSLTLTFSYPYAAMNLYLVLIISQLSHIIKVVTLLMHNTSEGWHYHRAIHGACYLSITK